MVVQGKKSVLLEASTAKHDHMYFVSLEDRFVLYLSCMFPCFPSDMVTLTVFPLSPLKMRNWFLPRDFFVQMYVRVK